jgi:hypothetical protein
MKVAMAPSVTPPWTRVSVHRRRGIHSWCCIDRIFFHHHSGRRDYDRPPNYNCLGRNRSRLRYNDTGRGSVLVGISFTLLDRWYREVSADRKPLLVRQELEQLPHPRSLYG